MAGGGVGEGGVGAEGWGLVRGGVGGCVFIVQYT